MGTLYCTWLPFMCCPPAVAGTFNNNFIILCTELLSKSSNVTHPLLLMMIVKEEIRTNSAVHRNEWYRSTIGLGYTFLALCKYYVVNSCCQQYVHGWIAKTTLTKSTKRNETGQTRQSKDPTLLQIESM